MAPIGGVLLMLTGPKLLDKEPPPIPPTTIIVEKGNNKEDEDEERHLPDSAVERGGIVNGGFVFDRDVRRRSAIQLQTLDNRRGSKSNL